MDSTLVTTPKGKLSAFLFSFGIALNNHLEKQIDDPNFPIHPRVKRWVRKTGRNTLIFPVSNTNNGKRKGQTFLDWNKNAELLQRVLGFGEGTLLRFWMEREYYVSKFVFGFRAGH